MEKTGNGGFSNHKVIASESKSWYVGMPGTTKNSFSVTWSPGAMVLYGEKGSITLIFAGFNTYLGAKKWLAECSLEEFSGTVAHDRPENIEYFFHAFQTWGREPHYK